MGEEEKMTLWQKLRDEFSQFTSPIWILIFLVGVNSLVFDVGTLFALNVGERVVEFPVPSLGRLAGVIILLIPFWSFILRPIVRGIQRYTGRELPLEEQLEENKPKTVLEKVTKYARMFLPF